MITTRPMATRFFVRSLFRIALARLVELLDWCRFAGFLACLASLSFLEVEPIPAGLLFSTELSNVRSAVDLVGEPDLPTPG